MRQIYEYTKDEYSEMNSNLGSAIYNVEELLKRVTVDASLIGDLSKIKMYLNETRDILRGK